MNPVMCCMKAARRLRKFVGDACWAGNYHTWRALYKAAPGVQQVSVRFRGQQVPFWVCGRTIDIELARQILCENSEYTVPIPIRPKVILDIGANIGLTTLYFALTYPDSRVYCFEPLPENLELLRRNVAILGERAVVVPEGLSDREAVLTYTYSDDPRNFGGGFTNSDSGRRTVQLHVTTLSKVCRGLGVSSVDLIKLDAEGSEYAILKGAPLGLVEEAAVVIGELHGVEDWECLKTLSQTHRVGVFKRFDRTCFPFIAIKRGTDRTGR